MKKIFLLIFSMQVYAGAPVYTVLEQTGNSDSFNKSSFSKMSAKSASGDEITFDLTHNKSQSSEKTVKLVSINGQHFEVGLQDELDPSQSIPFFKLSFPDRDQNREIYVLAGPRGTSGASFHYFVQSGNGKYIYSGLHPEITYDEQREIFYSVEKDGPRAHLTTWKLQNSRFVAQKEESVE